MGVRKFRSIEEMNAWKEERPLDPNNLRIAIAHSKTCLALDRRRMPAGVRKFRSADEAWASRLAWERGEAT
jgi:hypothetical protein